MMKCSDVIRRLLRVAAACLVLASCSESATSLSPLVSQPFQKVTLEDEFFLPRLQRQKEVLVPFALEKTRSAVDNLRKTAHFQEGVPDELPFAHRYISSDLYKVMEGAAYLLATVPDKALEARMDSIIDFIARAQSEDGYLYESHITGVSKGHENVMGSRPYAYVLHSHELYDMGHMYEAAIAYYLATGKRRWLDVAQKNARHINKVFFEGDPAYNDGKPVLQAPGHPELELALVKLYKVTGDTLYLGMAKRFIDIRGVSYVPPKDGTGVMAPEYAQQHQPLREQREAVGHSVRALYLYSGMVDVSGLCHDGSFDAAIDSIWNDIVSRKMHITGGLGSVGGIEGFGPAYLLPNYDTYDETCAAVGNVLLNYRLFEKTHEGKYLDVAETALYNNVLAGVNLEGNRFFYVNPLQTDGLRAFNQGVNGRAEWFDTACCPSNLARLIPQLPGMMYATDGDEVFLGLYAGSSTTLELPSGSVSLTQRTRYPFSGDVALTVRPQQPSQRFVLNLRVPSWAYAESVTAGTLYHYKNGSKASVRLLVNGKQTAFDIKDGYIRLDRKWNEGDQVRLELPLQVRYVAADERVEDDLGRLCVTRGPLVYCAEGVDNEAGLDEYQLRKDLPEGSVRDLREGLLQGIPSIELPARRDGSETTLKMLPYYAWDNRGHSEMNVWFHLEP